MKIIGISAKMRCGKTTFTKYLLELLGSKWKKLSFGDVLKEECSAKFNFPLEWCYSEEGKNRKINVDFPDNSIRILTVRKLLQWWGTDVCRAKDPDYWVKKAFKKIALLDKTKIIGIVIDDVRFYNEYINCDITVRLDQYDNCIKSEGHDHESETALDFVGHWSWRTKPAYGDLKNTATEFYQVMKIRGMI